MTPGSPPRDPFDEGIRRRLQGLAPRGDDTDEVLDALRPRARRARSRHRVNLLTGSAVTLAFVVASGVGLARQARDPDDISTITSATHPSTTELRATSAPSGTTTSTAAPPSITSGPNHDGGPSHSPTTVGSPVTSSPASGPPDTGGPRTSSPTTAATTIVERTYSGTGGSITIRSDGTALILVSTHPNAGYTTEVTHNESTRIEVRFRSGSHDTGIEVRLTDGQLTHRVSENGG